MLRCSMVRCPEEGEEEGEQTAFIDQRAVAAPLVKTNHTRQLARTSKDLAIGPSRPEKSGVSKLSRTFGHPVAIDKIWMNSS